MKREIYFIRHGESEANVKGLLCGSWDAELSLNGREQIHTAVNIVKNLGVNRVITSPLKRAYASAKIIAQSISSLEFTVLDELQEQNYGDWEGRLFEEVKSEFLLSFNPPHGEGHAIFRERIQKAWNGITALEGRSLIVAHGGVGTELMSVLGHTKRLINNAEVYRLI